MFRLPPKFIWISDVTHDVESVLGRPAFRAGAGNYSDLQILESSALLQGASF